MVKLTHADKRVLDAALDMGTGYVLDFSDRTMSEFFEDELGIQIYQEKYAFNGASKAKHMRAFIEVESAYVVSRVLRRLWEYRDTLQRYRYGSDYDRIKESFFAVLTKIEGGGAVATTDAIYLFKQDQTLEELISDIERDIHANRPAAAIDRLILRQEVRLPALCQVHTVVQRRATAR